MDKTILLIDDLEYITSTLKYAFEKEGYTVYFSDNGQSGLETLQKHHIDLIITDLNMPKMNGIEFIKTVRNADKHKDIPIIVLTTNYETKEQSQKAGANGWVVKPYNFRKILTAAERFLAPETKGQ